MRKFLDLEGLRLFDEKMKEYIDKKIELSKFSFTNCPNCGAIITSSKCEYCRTDFSITVGEILNSR